MAAVNTMLFGTFQVSLTPYLTGGVTTHVAQELMAPPPHVADSALRRFAKREVAKTETQLNKAWLSLDKQLNKRLERQGLQRTIVDRSGYVVRERVSAKRFARYIKMKEHNAFMSKEHEVNRIEMRYCKAAQVEGTGIAHPKWPRAIKKQRVVKTYTPQRADIGSILSQLGPILRDRDIKFELVSNKKVVTGRYRDHKSHRSVFLDTLHCRHILKPVDLVNWPELNEWIYRLSKCTFGVSSRLAVGLTYGSSGLVLSQASMWGQAGRSYHRFFVVRGRSDNTIIDARSKISRSVMRRMDHYSSISEKFWKGFEKTYVKVRPEASEHICTPDFDVMECGEVIGLTLQTIAPTHKITCAKCADKLLQVSDIERLDLIDRVSNAAMPDLRSNHPKFQFITHTLEQILARSHSQNSNFIDSKEVTRLIGGDKVGQMLHMGILNDTLIKGGMATSEELSNAQKSLLEVVRFYKRRADNVRKGDLSVFRNRVSGKAHVNATLMCDNQRDKNGNFIWGARGYHAKRFLSAYYDVIDPSKGYDQFVERRGPNGVRKLAINNLMMSTKFEVLRKQLVGEPIEPITLQTQCTSLRNNNFVYPCCCVTLDDGVPLLSDLKMPTKNHLIVGNAGDPKCLDMPTDISEQMYIAKNGYCYVNIFVAMLVNVDETDAKSFTKMTRDVLISQLGEWPSMMDLATACHYLAVFFPSTRDAELPRILVDHDKQTMHVIDSYGSLTTGYHVLKANTVNQLIQFASDDMVSEMKLYRVGGSDDEEREEINRRSGLKLLIKGIYKPSLMREIIESEPYLLVMSLISPGILVALHNSQALEMAARHWLTPDLGLAQMMIALSVLAEKVSVARLLTDKFQLIGAYAFDIMNDGTIRPQFLSAIPALDLVYSLANKQETDEDLRSGGYRAYHAETIHFIEKNYLEDLNRAWNELSLLEKSCLTYRSWRWRIGNQKYSEMKGASASSVRSSTSYGASIAAYRVKIRDSVAQAKSLIGKCERRCRKKCLNTIYRTVNWAVPDVLRFINVLIIISLAVGIAQSLQTIVSAHREALKNSEGNRIRLEYKQLKHLREIAEIKLKREPSKDEFILFVSEIEPRLLDSAKRLCWDIVDHQAKKDYEVRLEQGIAFTSLICMLFDAERSDCLYRILNKVKSLFGALDQVRHQSLDEIKDDLEKNLTVDFEIDTSPQPSTSVVEYTFEQWWDNQISNSRVVPHYRTEGHFMEFTRATAAVVANEIAHQPFKDYLIRGAVGSGKSTGLPFHLSKKGSVLLLEPTRPLTENVAKQLRREPFYMNPTVRMRGLSTFGSSPVTVMTTGYAFHYLANNPTHIDHYEFIILDESHVLDSSAMALTSLLHEYQFKGKLLKVSATPPGRETEFTTQCPVTLKVEESLSFDQFVANQGTGVNSDVLSFGHNILVYVASYNEVDILSKKLIEKGYKVTKVDGRTMKVGSVEIATCGNASRKHFIVATNIIENGVTLDIDVVVDFGVKVLPELDVDNRLIRYTKVAVNYGERIQRLGRVGRNKEGMALRIGHTEKGLQTIPSMIATEAAFMCFTHNLPVMTSNVSTSLLASCTRKQANTMQQFELPVFFMSTLVRFDGSMHPLIHSALKQYKLRDSEVNLNKFAIPYKASSIWIKAVDYNRMGARLTTDPNVKIPFYSKDVPDKVYECIWDIVERNKNDCGFGHISSHSASKIAYTLQTDVHSIPRTLQLLEELIAREHEKQAHFHTAMNLNCSSSNFTLNSVFNSIRAKYAKDHTVENISILSSAKAQILEYRNLHMDKHTVDHIQHFGALDSVRHQSLNDLSAALNLKGVWNTSLMTRDVIVLIGVAAGCGWMVYEWFTKKMLADVHHQGFNKRQRQKLKFRDARTEKIGREVFADDGTIEHYFGSAYTKKGKVKGTTRGMGTKTRKFVNMYGYDPSDYSFVRFVDPLTGYTLDETPYADIRLIQELFGEKRAEMILNDELDKQHVYTNPGIEAYYVKNSTTPALKVDLTPHNPLLMCANTSTIAGFPEREGELRQTGRAITVDFSAVPKEKSLDAVEHEGKSLFMGPRDYNPIASVICNLTNESDGYTTTLYGIGYGSKIIANQHLFTRNNGTLTVRSHHGEFLVKNTSTLKLLPCKGFDLIIIQMPKDFPPFPKRIKFREPVKNEKVCIVSSNFQDKHVSSMVSEVSITYQKDNSSFYKHWISTKDGDCGLPIVSIKDFAVLGIHSLTDCNSSENYYANIPERFLTDYLENESSNDWIKHWKYNPNNISWGSMQLATSLPTGLFKIQKLISDLDETVVRPQGRTETWLHAQLRGNLKAVAKCPNQLVTKHSVVGKCPLFATYLGVDAEAEDYFRPLMGAYGKSKLNREAYIKDVMKYSGIIVVGEVEINAFERAKEMFVSLLKENNFPTCVYITDTEDIFGALNMKAAVGALYSGKKRDYFEAFTESDKDAIIKDSCERLYDGKLGVWNGSLKSELRPMAKLIANKTRSFTAAPIDTLLGGKVCVDDFNNHFYLKNTQCPWTVGMTKFHKGWDKVLTQLPDGWLYCDADGSQFDSSLSPFLINTVLRIRLDFMEEWDIGEKMLSNLYAEILYTPIATPDGTIVKKFKGNNSGQPSTVVDNTIMVILALYYTLISVGESEATIREKCKFFVNGDDLILALHPDIEHHLGKFQEKFSQLGLNYTFDNTTRNRSDLWFMSHQGVLRDGVYIPNLEPERVVSILEWNRTHEPENRLEAICAALVEAWGDDKLVHEIRRFYSWVLEQEPYKELAKQGKAPYVSELALRKLYLDLAPTPSEIQIYLKAIEEYTHGDEDNSVVCHQADETRNAGINAPSKGSDKGSASQRDSKNQPEEQTGKDKALVPEGRDTDVNVGTSGTFHVPRLKTLSSKLTLPKVRGKIALNLNHLLQYTPEQVDLYNTRSTREQFDLWYDGVKADYDVTDEEMSLILNGLMVWCIENGTSPNLNGMWVMMDGETQVTYPIKPLIDHARPTFRQIMAHFSNVAEAYIEKRNYAKPYMPRYGLQRNLRDYSLARYAFDFYELTAKTPALAREAHIQMKAAALRNANNSMFGLDGSAGTNGEDTERHTVDDVNRNMHSLLGVKM